MGCIKIIRDMYNDTRTSVKSVCLEKWRILGKCWCSPGIGIKSVFVFVSYAKSVQDEATWCVVFVDDLVLLGENTNVLKIKLERRLGELEKNRLIISRAKTEFKFDKKEKRRTHK